MRCNCGIDPKKLTDEHLFAESRELKMLPSLFERVGPKHIGNVPQEFTLGKGHMLFFLYKWKYSYTRYCNCITELKKRGYNITDERNRWKIYKGTYCEAFFSTGKEADIIKQRIIERIQASPKSFFHYYHERITKEDAIKILLS